MPPKVAIKVKQGKSKDRARAVAMDKLRAHWNGVEGEEFDPSEEIIITPLLKAVDGGIPALIHALRAYDEDDTRDFLETYDMLTATDRNHVSLEEISYAAGVGSLRLAEVAQTAVLLSGQIRTKLILASKMPKVVEKSIKMALKDEGLTDRGWILQAGNVRPMPKGNVIAIQNNNGAVQEEKETPKDAPALWQTADERLRAIHDMTEARRLPAPASSPIVIGGKLDHLQSDVLVERDV
ncbi:MAG TPA: hypothetical protein VGK96_28490 [Candidatus Sulfotelmatobacter sp.]|jgi:hypothetical protein